MKRQGYTPALAYLLINDTIEGEPLPIGIRVSPAGLHFDADFGFPPCGRAGMAKVAVYTHTDGIIFETGNYAVFSGNGVRLDRHDQQVRRW